jgi:hypothetical protein
MLLYFEKISLNSNLLVYAGVGDNSLILFSVNFLATKKDITDSPAAFSAATP